MFGNTSVEAIVIKHTPPLLNDSSLVFLTTARIYARLHDDLRVIKHHVKVGGCASSSISNIFIEAYNLK